MNHAINIIKGALDGIRTLWEYACLGAEWLWG